MTPSGQPKAATPQPNDATNLCILYLQRVLIKSAKVTLRLIHNGERYGMSGGQKGIPDKASLLVRIAGGNTRTDPFCERETKSEVTQYDKDKVSCDPR